VHHGRATDADLLLLNELPVGRDAQVDQVPRGARRGPCRDPGTSARNGPSPGWRRCARRSRGARAGCCRLPRGRGP
jgi:hypothetical protein